MVDALYLALIAVFLLLDHFVLWPAFLRWSQADPGRARLRLWWGWMIEVWTLAGAGVALWLTDARDWGALRFAGPHGWRLWGAVGLALALTIAYGRTFVRLSRSRKRIQLANPHAARIAPHGRSELAWWVALSLSAGFCEEFVFRGDLIWAFQPRLGLWGAAALSLAVFAAAHAYQGSKGVLAVGIIGSVFTLIVLILGSLWPAMVLHAMVDIGDGLVSWIAFRSEAA